MASAAAKAPAKSKAKALKEPPAKKTVSGARKPRAYPSYHEMIKEAIVALKERTGSSQIAITKFIEEKQKSNLPANFKKLLLVQLKKLVADGKLVKVKNSFKLPPRSPAASSGTASAAAPAKKTPAPTVKPKAKVETKAKAAPPKRKAAAETKPKKAAKTVATKSPGKKVVVAAAKKKAPAKGAKKPKSIKSPAKKATARKAKK